MYRFGIICILYWDNYMCVCIYSKGIIIFVNENTIFRLLSAEMKHLCKLSLSVIAFFIKLLKTEASKHYLK